MRRTVIGEPRLLPEQSVRLTQSARSGRASSNSPPLPQRTWQGWGTRSLLEADALFQRQVLRGAAHHKCVVARDQLPAILVDIEDGKIERIDLHRNVFALAGIQLHLAPAHETFGRLSRRGWQGSVDLRNLRAVALSSVLYRKREANSRSRRHLEIRIGVRSVGKAVSKRKLDLFVLGVIPLVTNLQALVIGDLEDGQTRGDSLPRIRFVVGGGFCGRLRDSGMRKIGVA